MPISWAHCSSIQYEFQWIHVMPLPIFFSIVSLACDCPSASEVILKDMGKIKRLQTTTITKCVHIFRDVLLSLTSNWLGSFSPTAAITAGAIKQDIFAIVLDSKEQCMKRLLSMGQGRLARHPRYYLLLKYYQHISDTYMCHQNGSSLFPIKVHWSLDNKPEPMLTFLSTGPLRTNWSEVWIR